MTRLLSLSTFVIALVSADARGQRLADRVGSARDGIVSFSFAARDGVCGDGDQFMKIGGSSFGAWSGTRSAPCVFGPVQVSLTLHDGDVERIQTRVGPPRARGEMDLGAVPAAEAASYLMRVAARGRGTASTKAILPAVLADSATVWPALLAIARDTATRPRSTRQEAAFWLSRFAGGAVLGHRNDPMAETETEPGDNDDLKSHAVFVLSQLPRGEGVPSLLDVARTNRDPHVRSQALFWLGQSGDPRALALFELLLQ
jgi:hypothetical protein